MAFFPKNMVTNQVCQSLMSVLKHPSVLFEGFYILLCCFCACLFFAPRKLQIIVAPSATMEGCNWEFLAGISQMASGQNAVIYMFPALT